MQAEKFDMTGSCLLEGALADTSASRLLRPRQRTQHPTYRLQSSPTLNPQIKPFDQVPTHPTSLDLNSKSAAIPRFSLANELDRREQEAQRST